MKLLLVDDHTLFLESLQNLLTLHGYQVVGQAGDGLEAVKECRRFLPDLVLMDIEMPRFDGLAATRIIKAEMPDVRIVMLTVSADDEKLFEAIKSGASGYLLKSLRAPELLRHLNQLDEGILPMSSGLADKVLKEFARQAERLEAAPSEEGEGNLGLTGRQIEILTLVGQGLTYSEVGETLCLGERTIRYHMKEIIERLHLKNRAQVIAYAASKGLIEAPNKEET